MRAHYSQHVPFERLGSIKSWLNRAGYGITKTPFFETVNLPDIGEIDLLVIMGGPMSVNDDVEVPWLVLEKEFIRNILTQNNRQTSQKASKVSSYFQHNRFGFHNAN